MPQDLGILIGNMNKLRKLSKSESLAKSFLNFAHPPRASVE